MATAGKFGAAAEPLASALPAQPFKSAPVQALRKPSRLRAALCAFAYCMAFLPVASVLKTRFGFPLDDSWIHEVVARNLATYKVLGFLPGQVSSGSTSLLWTILLAFRAMVFPALSPVIYCVILSVVLLAAIGFALKWLTESDRQSQGSSWCMALAPAASGNVLWFGMIGMEHLLFIFLSLCVILCWFGSPNRRGPLNALLLPGTCFLLVFTRPEGICLVALLLLFRKAAHRSFRDWMKATLGAVCAGALSAAVNLKTGHHLTPLTMQGRNGIITSHSWAELHAQFLTRSAVRMLSVWGINMPHVVLHGRGLLVGLPFLLLVGMLITVAVRHLIRTGSSRFVLLCAWGATIFMLYFFMLPSTGHGGRYIAVPILLFLPLVFLGLHTVLSATPLRRVAWTVVGVAAVATAVLSISVWRAVAAADIEQINTEHGEIASWIQQHIPESTIAHQQIAVFDIGRIGYQLGGNLTDLGGLVDYKFQPYLIQGRTTDYLQAKKIAYVVLPGDEVDPTSHHYSRMVALNPAHGAELTLLHTVCANSEVAAFAFDSSGTAAPCQRLYSIRYLAH